MRGTLASLRYGFQHSSLQATHHRTALGRICHPAVQRGFTWQQSRPFQHVSSKQSLAAFWVEEPEVSKQAVWQPLETLPEQALDDTHDTFPNNEAASFFSELSRLVNEPKVGPQPVLHHVQNSHHFQQSLEADHLGPPVLSVLNKAFEYVSLEYGGTAKPRNIRSVHAAELLRHENTFQRAKDVYNNIVELDRLVEIWHLFFLVHRAGEPQSDLGAGRPDSNDMQQQFFAPLAGWEYGQDLATDQRVFCSALMTSAVLFKHLGHPTLLWPQPSKDPFLEVRCPDFSLLDESELSLVSNLTLAVHGTTPNRMVLRLGLARMSVPSDASKILLDHTTSLTGHEEQIREQVEGRRVIQTESSTHQRGLAIRATQQLSRWIERATRTSLTEMYFAFTGNREFLSLAIAERPLLDKMSLRLFQIENDLPHSIWTGFSFDEKLAGERGTVQKSPALSAIILRRLYREAKAGRNWVMRKFEDEWGRLDLSRSRIPDALWWLRFTMLWRAKHYTEALDAYPVAISDITSRVTPEQRPAAVLRLTNQMLFIVALYGDLKDSRSFLRELLVRKIEFNAETYRWLIRLYIRLGRSRAVSKLLTGYQSRGGKGAMLGRELQMHFASLLRAWPQRSPTAANEVIYEAIDAALRMRDPEAVRNRDEIENPSLQEPHTAVLESLDETSMKDQLVDVLSVTRWKELVKTYHQLAKVISDGDYSNNAKLLVTLHEHLYIFIPLQRLPLDVRAMAKELEDVVIDYFNQATPSEQLLLPSGRLYWRQGNGFLNSGGAAVHNFKIMDAGLTSKFLCKRLEKADMAYYTRLFRGIRWPIRNSDPVWNTVPERQTAVLMEVVEKLQNQAAEMLPGTTPTTPVRFQLSGPVPQAEGSTNTVRRRKKVEADSRTTRAAQVKTMTRKIRLVGGGPVKGLHLPLAGSVETTRKRATDCLAGTPSP